MEAKRKDISIHEKMIIITCTSLGIGVTFLILTSALTMLCRYSDNYGSNGGQYVCIRDKT